MTPLRRWLRNLVERWRRQFYEGPEPPARLEQMVLEFAEMYPNATRTNWVLFAQGLARECYRSGYVRGYEWYHRDPLLGPEVEPEKLMLALDHDWEWMDRPVDLSNPDGVVPEVDERDPVRQQVEDQFGPQPRRHNPGATAAPRRGE